MRGDSSYGDIDLRYSMLVFRDSSGSKVGGTEPTRCTLNDCFPHCL